MTPHERTVTYWPSFHAVRKGPGTVAVSVIRADGSWSHYFVRPDEAVGMFATWLDIEKPCAPRRAHEHNAMLLPGRGITGPPDEEETA